MKILLSGAHGTGKSTINNSLMLLDVFKGYTQIDSVSELFASSLDTFKDKEKLLDFQLSVSMYCFARYINEENVVSSRSFADAYAYAMLEYNNGGNELFRDIAMLALNLAKRYSTNEYRHIYVPVMFELQSKGLRSANKQFQLEVDKYFREFYNLADIEYLEIKSLSNEDRVKEIVDYCGLGK